MKSNSTFFKWTFPDTTWVTAREGEVRIGQKVGWRTQNDSWKSYRYHILGIREDIGPQLNGGLPGARNSFNAFIGRFLAIQSNVYFSGNDCCVHGTIDLINETTDFTDAYIIDLDGYVNSWASEILAHGGVPIVIGGGHNNAFPLIKAASEFQKKGIAVVNMDPHADLRDLTGRHSGNPFSYALDNSYLAEYYCLGLHESYNNSAILQRLAAPNFSAFYYENWIDYPAQFYTDVETVFEQLKTKEFGVELDLDAIAFMPSSAFTPSGINMEQARYYVRKMAQLAGVQYVHFPEGAPQNALEDKIVGKALSYLVADFIKIHSNSSK